MVAILALLLVGGVMVLSGSVRSAFDGGAECLTDPGDCGDASGGGPGGGTGPGGGGGGGTTTTGGGATTTTSPAPTSTTLRITSGP
jgi:hypothetical protein